MTQDHTGSNLIAFDADGQFVYGFNNESTEFGLRRIVVLPDGLRQEQVVTAEVAPGTRAGFSSRTLDWSTNGLVLDTAVYRTPELTLLGRVNVQGGGCRPHTVPNRLLCAYNSSFDGSRDGALAVVDANTFVILAAPVYQRGQAGASLSQIVPGPSGQAALRMNATYNNSASDSVWLFTSPALK